VGTGFAKKDMLKQKIEQDGDFEEASSCSNEREASNKNLQPRR
jgi:hypothetical protein